MITKKTLYRTSPRTVGTSTVKKPAAAVISQCAFKNVFHRIRPLRSATGSMPWSDRIRWIAVRPSSCPTWNSSPRMQV